MEAVNVMHPTHEQLLEQHHTHLEVAKSRAQSQS